MFVAADCFTEFPTHRKVVLMMTNCDICIHCRPCQGEIVQDSRTPHPTLLAGRCVSFLTERNDIFGLSIEEKGSVMRKYDT